MSSATPNRTHKPPVETTLGKLGLRNHGVFTHSEAREHGVTKDQLRRRVAWGYLYRPYPRVYVVAAVARTPEQDMAAARAWAGPAAVFSYGTAAALWGLRGFDLGPPIELSSSRFLRSCATDLRVHRVDEWDRGDLCHLDQWTLTTPARTVIDLAARLSAEHLRDVVDEVLLRELSDVTRLRRRLEACGRRGRSGAGQLFTLIEEFDGSGLLPRSVLERRYMRAAAAAKLPSAVVQYPVTVEDRRYIIDFAYPEQMVGVELDGWRFHGSRRAWEADIKRANALVAAGWQVIRGTWRGVQRNPHTLLSQVSRLLIPALSSATLDDCATRSATRT